MNKGGHVIAIKDISHCNSNEVFAPAGEQGTVVIPPDECLGLVLVKFPKGEIAVFVEQVTMAPSDSQDIE